MVQAEADTAGETGLNCNASCREPSSERNGDWGEVRSMQADDRAFWMHLAASGVVRAVLQGSAPLQEWLREQLCLITPLTDPGRLAAAPSSSAGTGICSLVTCLSGTGITHRPWPRMCTCRGGVSRQPSAAAAGAAAFARGPPCCAGRPVLGLPASSAKQTLAARWAPCARLLHKGLSSACH